MRAAVIRKTAVAAMLLGAPLVAVAEEARHSGTVVRTGDNALVLREMVTWTGAGTGVIERRVALTDDTAVQLVQRGPWTDDARARPGWTATELRPDDIRTGDFATVTTRPGDAGGDVAVSVQLLRPGT